MDIHIHIHIHELSKGGVCDSIKFLLFPPPYLSQLPWLWGEGRTIQTVHIRHEQKALNSRTPHVFWGLPPGFPPLKLDFLISIGTGGLCLCGRFPSDTAAGPLWEPAAWKGCQKPRRRLLQSCSHSYLFQVRKINLSLTVDNSEVRESPKRVTTGRDLNHTRETLKFLILFMNGVLKAQFTVNKWVLSGQSQDKQQERGRARAR